MKKEVQNHFNKWFATLVIGFLSAITFGQTVLINPSLEGGFEVGSTFAANGWTVSNSANNPWVVGTAVSAAPIGGNSAYVSNDGGTTNAYTNNAACVNYFYRDVTVPAGESKIKLTFNWQQQGESTFDLSQVFVAPTSITPVGVAASQGSGLNTVPVGITGATYVTNTAIIPGVQTTTAYLPSSLAGTTFRLIFSWKNDGSGGVQPPASIDNISLTSELPGTFISVVTGNWTTASTWDANAVPTPADQVTVSTGHVVTIDAVNQGADNLIVNGTLNYSTTPATFNVNGNLTVSSTGAVNVYNATTGKGIVVSGNIINNGSIDISVGTTTAGTLTLNGSGVQTISGTGTFGATNVIRNLVCSNTNTSTPNIVWSINNVKIAYNLNMTGAKIDLGTNKITFGNNAVAGTLTVPVGCGFLPGAKFSRWWTATATGSTITAGALPTTTTSRYPFINSNGDNRSMWITRINTTTATAGELAVVYANATTSTSGLSVDDAGYIVTDRYDGNWSVSNEGTGVSTPGAYRIACVAQSAFSTLNGNVRILHAGTTASGTHQNGSNLPMGQRITVTDADLISSPFYIGIASVDQIPATPGTITQSVALPTCVSGTTLTSTGTPETNVTWYWQTSATGTSQANPYTGPYTVFANGTYYLNAYNSVSTQWSANASSYTVTNFPVAPAPPAPVAATNPSCAPAGSSLTVASAPLGTTYYWQGTVLNGSDNSLDATSPYAYTASGTYYVSAYEAASQCWSPTTGITVTVDTQIPYDPVVTDNVLNICAGSLTGLISAATSSAAPGSLATTTAGGNGCGGGAMIDITTNGNPIVLTDIDAIPNASGAQTVNVYYKTGSYIGSETVAGNWTLLGTFAVTTTTGTAFNIDIADLSIPASTTYAIYVNYPAQYTSLTSTYTNADLTIATGAGLCSQFGGVNAGRTFNGAVNYTIPMPATAAWFDAPIGGNVVGTGSPFETVGTSVLPTATLGSYNFYAASQLGGCYSTNRELVTVYVNSVNATLTAINPTCNGGTNGSFSLGTVDCGTLPFTYSLDNGVTFGPIPTNLVDGTYTVIIQDANTLLSGPISLTLNQPAAPSNLTVVQATYFTADISWTTTGNETQWNVTYGPVGFDPATSGTTIQTNTTAASLTGLTANTAYDVYVSAVCGTNAEFSDVLVLNTNPGFFTFDNSCGSGFIDISGSGTNLNLTDDSEAGVTLPWSWNVNGTTVNTITVGNNGGILFNTLTGNVATTATGNGLFPYAQDLDDVLAGGGVYYQNIGTAPNQQFVIMWDNAPHFSTGTDGATFEIIIDQATGGIYYIYDDVNMSNSAWDFGADAEIAANTSNGNVQVSMNNNTYLQNNSCVHLYNALCPNPTNVSTLVFQEEIDITWSAGAYGETDWTVIYGPVGFDPSTSGTILTTSTPDIQITGLTQLNEYDVYIYSECALDNLTSDGFLVNATTLPWCADPITLNGTSVVDSIMMTWDWIPAAAATNGGISSFNIQYGQTGYNLYSGTEFVANGIDFADTIDNSSLLPGQVIDVYVQSVCGVDTSNFVGPFTITMPISNDTVCGAQELMVDGTVYIFNNTGATVSAGETSIVPSQVGYNVTDLPSDGWGQPTLQRTTWFTFTAPASGAIRFTGEDLNTSWSQIAIYESLLCNDFNTFNLVAASDQANVTSTTVGNTTTIDTIKVAPNFTICGLTPGSTYYIMHDSWAGANGSTTLQGQYSIKMTPIVLEAGSFVDVLDVCTGSSVVMFDGITGYDSNGTWSAEFASVNIGLTDSLFNTSGYADQTYNFEYRVTDGCAYDSIVSQVKIFPLSSAGIDGTMNVCRNEPLDLFSGLTGVVDHGGSWYNPSNQLMPSSSIYASNIGGQFNYDYIAGNGVCPDDTANILVNVDQNCNWLNVEELNFSNMTLSPNPTNGEVFITNSGNTEIYNYEVLDVDGRIIATKNNAINGTTTTKIDLTGKVTGIYMVRVYNENAEKVFRVVLQ